MTNATITEQYLLDVLHKHSEGANFPINFDDIWESAGYVHKHHAVRFLQGHSALKKGKHYIVSPERVQTPQGGRSSHLIRMSIDGYQFFLSKSNTEQGDANLWYLIDVEKQYRKNLERQLKASVKAVESTTEQKQTIESLKSELRRSQEQLAKLEPKSELKKAQKACYIALSICKGYISDYEDLIEFGNGSVEYYADKLMPVLSKKVRETLDLSQDINDLLGVEVDPFEDLHGNDEYENHFTNM